MSITNEAFSFAGMTGPTPRNSDSRGLGRILGNYILKNSVDVPNVRYWVKKITVACSNSLKKDTILSFSSL